MSIEYATAEVIKKSGISGSPNVMLPFEFEPPISLAGVTTFGEVRIGRHSYMNSGMIRSHVSIGRFCSIGRNVVIAAGDHPLDALTTHPVAWQSRSAPVRPAHSTRRKRHPTTEIGHDVWIGDNVVIVPGVHIGTGAVIGANAVVTRDVETYSIVGGVPASPIRYRFAPEIVGRLIGSEWWLLDIEVLKTLNMNDVEGCLQQFSALKAAHGVDPIAYVKLTN